jgi:hypothetical protein
VTTDLRLPVCDPVRTGVDVLVDALLAVGPIPIDQRPIP